VDLAFPFERVWDAAWTALPLAGWELTRASKALGRFEAKLGVNLYTWKEEFSVQFAKMDEESTRVHVWGRAPLQAYDWGKTRKDTDRFISLIQTTLTER
jgi:hypothetical protein